MIPDDLRRELADSLLRVPQIGDLAGRTTLLAGIPQLAHLGRNPTNASGDVMMLILQLEDNFGPGGEWRLLGFIDNALPSVAGTSLAQELQELRRELMRVRDRIHPKQVHPAELAQPYLFDLRQPVLLCVNSLPGEASMCGFVVPTPTPRLLPYFCDSLKHRGVEERYWKRDQVAVTCATLRIDPLHTTVDLALRKACSNKPLLEKKIVVWAVYVKEASDAKALWLGLQDAFRPAPGHHFVVVFGMPANAHPPAGLMLLPSPVFTKKDISDWVGAIAERLAWRDGLVKRWTAVIINGYADSENDLPIECVYERLEFHRDLVTKNQTEEALIECLSELELIGE